MSKIKIWFKEYFWNIVLVGMLVMSVFGITNDSVTDKRFILDVGLTIILAIYNTTSYVRKDLAKLIENNKK